MKIGAEFGRISIVQNSNPYRIESVDRALTILTMLGSGQAVSVTRAQKELGVAPSTAHRILATLVGRNFAVQGKDRLYRAGPALLSPGRTHAQAPVTTVLRPFLESLFASVEETVHLIGLKGSNVTYLDGIEGKQTNHASLQIGTSRPAATTSAGKAMLQMAKNGRPKDKIFIGTNQHDIDKGITTFGVALGMINNHELAISIAVPTARMTRDREMRLKHALTNTYSVIHHRFSQI